MATAGTAAGIPVDQLVGSPKDRFLDPAWHVRDLDIVFRPTWHMAAHESQLPDPGSFIVFALGDDEAVIVRTRSRELRAFYNVCPHRGHRLFLSPEGTASNSTRIACPYHGWVFGLEDGACQAAVRMPADFDRVPWSLRPVRMENYHGLLFVSFARGDLPSVASLATPFGTGGYDVHKTKVARIKRDIINANWKIVVENNSECYHCTINHPELARRYDVWDTPIAQAIMGDAYLRDEGRAPDFEWIGMPLGDAYRRNTPEPGCRRPLARVDGRSAETFRLGWNPNGLIMVLPDYIWIWNVTPVAQDKTLVAQYWLVHDGAVEGVDYTPETVSKFFADVIEEDRSLCEQVQRGMRMTAYHPGPFNPVYQGGGLGFYEWYERRVAASR